MKPAIQSAPVGGRTRNYRIGWVMSGLVIAFLLMDATMKVLALPVVLEASGPLGFPGAAMASYCCFARYSMPRRKPRCSVPFC